MRTIYVEGNIIFETGVSWVRKIGAFHEKRYKAMADEVVIGDLLLIRIIELEAILSIWR